jgi:broad specificity phosphatase PhoE
VEQRSSFQSYHYADRQLSSVVEGRIRKFWDQEIISLGKESIVLIISHSGVLKRLKNYLKSKNYQLQSANGPRDLWNGKIENGSMFTVVVETEGQN